jgi:hypothetical protein
MVSFAKISKSQNLEGVQPHATLGKDLCPETVDDELVYTRGAREDTPKSLTRQDFNSHKVNPDCDQEYTNAIRYATFITNKSSAVQN